MIVPLHQFEGFPDSIFCHACIMCGHLGKRLPAAPPSSPCTSVLCACRHTWVDSHNVGVHIPGQHLEYDRYCKLKLKYVQNSADYACNA